MAIKIEMVGDQKVDVLADDIAEFIGHFSEHLSSEGVFLKTAVRPPRGRELQLSMRLRDGFELVNSLAMVAWQRNPRVGSQMSGGVALHLLKVEEGAEFLTRLVREHEAQGGVAFSADRAAPLTEDGSPPPADALDRMMAQRGDRSGTEELGTVEADPQPDVVDEKGPEFAPGFGKADLWDSEVSAGIPGQINEWLAEEAVPQVTDPSLPPLPVSTGVAKAAMPEPKAAATAWPARADRTGSESEEPKVRSGPIKMRLAADRQPASAVDAPSASDSRPASDSSSSFVEASRRATELISESTAAPMPSNPAELRSAKPPVPHGPQLSDKSILGEGAAVSTVAIKPGELARMMDRAGAEAAKAAAAAEAADGAQASGDVGVEAERGRTSEGSAAASPVHDSRPSSKESPVPKDAVDGRPAATSSEEAPSALTIDPDVLHAADAIPEAGVSFGFPEEDRSPMVVLGLIVAAIVVALVLWGVVF